MAPSPAAFHLDTLTAGAIFFTASLVAALWSPIQDCDEVYNYWEPTHYLNHGYGMQTWEYSPEYAIRSWAYIGLHALAIVPARLFPVGTKVMEFYFLRVILAFVCAAAEARLFSVISRTLNPRVAIMFLVIMVSSPAMFHASTAYLPSSFAMYTTMLGMAAFMNWREHIRTGQGIFWVGLGAILGWPFAVAMVTPYLIEEFIIAWALQDFHSLFWRLTDGTIKVLIILVFQLCIDAFFYRKLVCVPLNIVWYNVFSSGKGPNMYGTEPWHFYLRNLTLNFNIWFLLAFLAFPLVIVQSSIGKQHASKQNLMRGLVFVAPMYIWLAIFSIQPHKEERFMYPAYPSIALNAAFSLHVLLSLFGSTNPKSIVGRIPPQIKLAFVSTSMLTAIGLGVWRAIGIVTAYSAPLQVYAPLHAPGVARPGNIVCLGKEWYRFPSSYHLPDGVRARFVKSEFKGLLPGEFSEANVGFGVYPGTWLIPPGMNDENREDPGKYIDITRCDFMVDSLFPSSETTKLEPHHVLDDLTWQPLLCEAFLDTMETNMLGRLGPLPNWSIVPERFRRRWGKYCLLKRKARK
ncbi:MAG: mannosyltransferase [Bathelium mastoideum]|nr:MAG: mannosyltransferase [Bathelium mastoideum]